MFWLIRLLLLFSGMLFTAPLIFGPSSPQGWSLVLFIDVVLFGLADLARDSYERRVFGERNVRERPKLRFLLVVALGICGLMISITHLLISDYNTALYGLLIALFIFPDVFRRWRSRF